MLRAVMIRLAPKRALACKSMGPAFSQLQAAALTTYSGGQPSEGQGGFYGALRSRSEKQSKFEPGCRAEQADVDTLDQVMTQFTEFSQQQDEAEAWRRVAQGEQVQQLLQKLIVKGSPVWGLSKEQRDFVAQLKSKLQSE